MLLCFRLYSFFHCLVIAVAQLRRAGTASLYFYTVSPALRSSHALYVNFGVAACHCDACRAGLELLAADPLLWAGFRGQPSGSPPTETPGNACDSEHPRVLGASAHCDARIARTNAGTK